MLQAEVLRRPKQLQCCRRLDSPAIVSRQCNSFSFPLLVMQTKIVPDQWVYSLHGRSRLGASMRYIAADCCWSVHPQAAACSGREEGRGAPPAVTQAPGSLLPREQGWLRARLASTHCPCQAQLHGAAAANITMAPRPTAHSNGSTAALQQSCLHCYAWRTAACLGTMKTAQMRVLVLHRQTGMGGMGRSSKQHRVRQWHMSQQGRERHAGADALRAHSCVACLALCTQSLAVSWNPTVTCVYLHPRPWQHMYTRSSSAAPHAHAFTTHPHTHSTTATAGLHKHMVQNSGEGVVCGQRPSDLLSLNISGSSQPARMQFHTTPPTHQQ